MSKYEIILLVCETGNISKAALKLNYSHSAVSQAVQSFEKELGVSLFKRSKAGVQILPGMEYVVQLLRHIVDEEKQIREFADSIKNLEYGVVRIGSISSVAVYWLPHILSGFSALYPQISYELHIGTFGDLQNMLANEEVDFAFTSRMAAQELEFVPLLEDEMMVILSRNHPLSSHVSIPVSLLKNQAIILSAEEADYEIGEILKNNHLHPAESKYIVNEDFTTIKLVEFGFGISILPKLFLEANTADICIRPMAEHYYRNLGIAYPAKDHPTPASQKFIAFAIQWLRKHSTNLDKSIYTAIPPLR